MRDQSMNHRRLTLSFILAVCFVLLSFMTVNADGEAFAAGCEINNSTDHSIQYLSGFSEEDGVLQVEEGAEFMVSEEACVSISGAVFEQAEDTFTVTGITDEYVVITVNDHTFGEAEITTAATCAKAGTSQTVCSECGYTKTEEIPATGRHTWDAGKVTKKATSPATGTRVYTCKVCKQTRLESIPKASAPTGTVIIRNTIANSSRRTNDVIWDKSSVRGATGYEINWRARGAKTCASKKVGNTVRGTTTGLTIGGLYEFRVRPYKAATATTAETYGAWSATVYRYFHTTETIRLASKKRGCFTMSWKKNASATGYQVMYTRNSNGAGAANNIRNVGASSNSYTQTGLNPGSTYYVQVREIRKVGGINYIGNISCPVAVKILAVNPVTASAAASVSGGSSGGGIVYWTPNGEVYHLRRNCRTLARSRTVYSGTRAQSGKSRACKVCG